jgi:hypothetical protein
MNHDLGEVEMLPGLGGSLSLQYEGLGKQHPGHADECYYQEKALDDKLAGVHVLLALRAVLCVFLPNNKILS